MVKACLKGTHCILYIYVCVCVLYALLALLSLLSLLTIIVIIIISSSIISLTITMYLCLKFIHPQGFCCKGRDQICLS